MNDRESIPLTSMVLGFGPMILLLLFAAGAWLLPPDRQPVAVTAGWLFGAAILIFLGGITRGLSFMAPGGARPAQLAQMLWLTVLGFGALLAPFGIAFVLLPLGYASVGLFDPPAARAGLAPAHFRQLRPPQMTIGVVALFVLLARVLLRG